MSLTQGMGEKTMRNLYKEFGERVKVPDLTLSSGRRSFTTIMKSFCGASEVTIAKSTKHRTGSHIPRYNNPTKDYLGSPSRRLGEARKIAFCLKEIAEPSYDHGSDKLSKQEEFPKVKIESSNISKANVGWEQQETVMKTPNLPGLIKNESAESPTKFRVFREKCKNERLSIDEVLKAIRNENQKPTLQQPPQFGYRSYSPILPPYPYAGPQFVQNIPHALYQQPLINPFQPFQYPYQHPIPSHYGPYFTRTSPTEYNMPIQSSQMTSSSSSWEPSG